MGYSYYKLLREHLTTSSSNSLLALDDGFYKKKCTWFSRIRIHGPLPPFDNYIHPVSQLVDYFKGNKLKSTPARETGALHISNGKKGSFLLYDMPASLIDYGTRSPAFQ